MHLVHWQLATFWCSDRFTLPYMVLLALKGSIEYSTKMVHVIEGAPYQSKIATVAIILDEHSIFSQVLRGCGRHLKCPFKLCIG